jgi:hypothetical protein
MTELSHCNISCFSKQMSSNCHKIFISHSTSFEDSKYVLIFNMYLTKAFVFPINYSCVSLVAMVKWPNGWQWIFIMSTAYIRECIQKFPDWLPGARTANGTAAITLCDASQWVFVVIYFIIDSVQKLLDTPLYTSQSYDTHEMPPPAYSKSVKRLQLSRTCNFS